MYKANLFHFSVMLAALFGMAHAEPARVTVEAVDDEGAAIPWAVVVITDATGARLDGPSATVEAGSIGISVTAEGFKSKRVRRDATDGARFTIALAYGDGLVFEIEDEVPALVDEGLAMTRNTIDVIPGAGGDPLKALQNLPGVGRTPVGLGGLILRGSSPRDTSVFLDGIKVPILYHFGGLTSFMPAEMLDDVTLQAGGFDVRYGRSQGGLVEVTSRGDLDDGRNKAFEADVNLIDAKGFAAAPLYGGTIKAAIRRSYVDAILAAAPLGDQIDLTIAPQYYDGQLMWNRSFKKLDIKLLTLFSIDRTALEVEQDNGNSGSFSLTQGFWRVGTPIRWRINDSWELNAVASIGQDTADFRVTDSKLDFGVFRYTTRAELSQLGDRIANVSIGVDYEGGDFRTDIRNNLPRGLDPAQREQVEVKSSNLTNDIGVFSRVDIRPLQGLQIVPGVRLDYFQRTGEIVLNPRIKLAQDFGPFQWVSSVGLYHQPPVPADVTEQFGNPDLKSANSKQASTGLRKDWGNGKAKIEGFYEILDDQHVDAVSGATPLANSRYAGGLGSFTLESSRETFGRWSYQNNRGIGRNYGLELFAQHRAEKWFGWVSYTWARSLRRDDPDWLPDYHIGVLDQPHTFNGVFAYELPKNWLVSTRLRLVSGYPYTAVNGAYYDTDQGRYQPLSDELLGERVPMFVQWDIRAQKTWNKKHVDLTLYLDVQNATNRINAEGVRYDFDYRNVAYTRGLPIFPSLGFEVKTK